jgi:hypothetical protein
MAVELKTSNIEHRTPNVEAKNYSMFDVGRWLFDVPFLREHDADPGNATRSR